MYKTILVSVALILTVASSGYSFDNEISHRDITKMAVENSSLGKYLSEKLDMKNGITTKIKNTYVRDWVREGSYLEDTPMCRATNHFHNPLLPWDQSYLSDQPTWLDLWCLSWKPTSSNIAWATGYLSAPPDGTKAWFTPLTSYQPVNWDNARDYYYKALVYEAKGDRDSYFVKALKAFGQVLHLLQDVAVPAHTRNDLTAHLEFNKASWNLPTNWFGNPFEYYVKTNPQLVAASSPASTDFPAFNKRLTDFWDTDFYNGSNPSMLNDRGLAEYSNANYLSDFTIPNNDPAPKHSFPYPYIKGSNSSGPSYEICEDFALGSTGRKVRYVGRKDKVGCDHFAAVSGFDSLALFTDSNTLNANMSKLSFVLDNNVHNTYAKELIPRAVSYSAALLDYFFRGSIDITLPLAGVYSSTNDADAGFTRITLLAQNKTSNGDEMSDGTIELVVKYKLAKSDPFQSTAVDKSDFYYAVFPEANGIVSIPRDIPVELHFDLGQNPLPVNATDVYLQIVYHGRLGNEDGAVAVGFKDISEPTPIDVFNNMDKICINNGSTTNWYDAGSQAAIEQVDKNGDGIAYGTNEWDIYPHNLTLCVKFYNSLVEPEYASPSSYDYLIENIPAGASMRALYVLGDSQVYYSYYPIRVPINADSQNPRDLWNHKDSLSVYTGYAVHDQDGDFPIMYAFRNFKMWPGAGFIYINAPYPDDSAQCPLSSL